MSKSTQSPTSPSAPLTYNKYLKVDELKKLQECLSSPPHHDEPLFIIIHQAYELWFKLSLHEIDEVFALLKADKISRATFYMKRVVAIFKLLVQQIHILETMSPKDFLGFRSNLNPASGFQSSQFREIEFACGLKDNQMLEHFKSDPEAYERLQERFQAKSLREGFFALLSRQGFDIAETAADESRSAAGENEEKKMKALVKLYEEPDRYRELYDLAESFVDMDELIYLWRAHHATVVERVIGFKRGTGGSEGVGYLQSTLTKRCFPELWKARTYLGA